MHNTPDMSLAYRVVIRGRVQGVSFRASMQQKAQQCHLVGWVRNMADGGVEAVFSGEEAMVQLMQAWLWHGPVQAEVRELHIEKTVCQDLSFEVRPNT